MLTFDEIYALALTHREQVAAKTPGLRIDRAAALETKAGWFFPWRSDEPCGGSIGFIVNKQTGRILDLGSRYSADHEIALYDAGYQMSEAFLVIHRVADLAAACAAITRLEFIRVEYEYAHGEVWNKGIPLSRSEIDQRLRKLPAVFGPFTTYFKRDRLEEIRASGSLEFELIEAKPTQH